MYTWDFIYNTVINHKVPIDFIFKRTPEIQQAYDEQKIKVLKEYESYKDYILIHYLKYETIIKNGKKCAKLDNKWRIRLSRNQFSYNLESSISHYVLWSSKPLRINHINLLLKNEARFKDLEYVWFINYKNARSIKDIWHIHILVNNNIEHN